MSRRNLFPTMSASQVVSRIGKTTKRRNPTAEDAEVFGTGETVTGWSLAYYLADHYNDEIQEANSRLNKGYPDLTREVLTVLYDFGVLRGPDRPTPTSNMSEGWTTTMPVSGDTLNVAVRQAMANFREAHERTHALADQLVARVYGVPVTPAPAAPTSAPARFPHPVGMFVWLSAGEESSLQALIEDLAWSSDYGGAVDELAERGSDWRRFAKAVADVLIRDGNLTRTSDTTYRAVREITNITLNNAVNQAFAALAAPAPAPAPAARHPWQPVGARAPAPAPAYRPAPDTSAYAFPKRCVGQPRNFGLDYRFTLIAPLCKMPLRFGEYDTEYKYYGYSPDKTRVYVGGYHGTYDTRMFNGMSFMRQHMLPGVMNDKDFGKGVGPACYMAGPLRVATIDDSMAGTFSPVGGRSNDADAAWYNLVQHKTAVQELINAREVTLKTYGLLDFAMKGEAGYYAKRPADVEPIRSKKLGQIQPDKLTVQAADAIYDYIYRKHILSLGIIVHINPQYEQKILGGMFMNVPIVPPPGIWSELDLSQTDANSLGEFLHYCSSNFSKYGNLTAGDYMRGALEALKQNPSSPMSDEELKTELAQYKPAKSVIQRKKRNPEVGADLSQETRLLSDFLNDEDWGEGGSVQNPAPRTFIPPPAVAAEARKGITLRASQPPSNRCCTPVGLRRAVQLANRQPVSETTLRRMKAYFDRHYGPDSRGKGWGVDSRGWQAHLCWGGDAGRKWVESILG